MRTIVFFDLPTITSKDQKNYRDFLKQLKKYGFYMLQESVYVKMCIDNQVVNSIVKKIETFAPSSGSIMVLTVTEKQFSQMNVIIGKNKSDVISSDSRTIVL